MIDIANIILYWLHIIATVVWIGGIVFILYVLIPKTKQILGEEAGKIIGEISKRFKLFADLSIIILILTGIGLSFINIPTSNHGISRDSWTILVILKHLLVLLMVLIHLYRNKILAKKIKKISVSSKKVFLQKLSLNLVKIVFIFGLIVLLLSVIASTWKQ